MLLATLVVASFSSLRATDYYVSINGNDQAGNGTAVAPWRTLRHAVSRIPANQGHRIILSAGTFVESGRIDVPEGVSILGAGIGNTIVTASSGFYRSYYSGFDHNLFLLKVTGGNQILKGFTLDGQNKNIYGGISVTYASDVEILHVKVQGFYFCGLWLWDVRNSSFHDSETYDNSWSSTGWGGGGIHIYKLYNVAMYNLKLTEIEQREGSKGGGVAIKALGSGNDNYCEKVVIRDCDVNVHPYGPWNNGQAPNISIEFWNVDTKDCEISNSIIRQHISLVSINDQQNAPLPESRYRFRIVDNQLISVGSYPIEISMNNIEVGNNYIDAAWTGYGIANWERRGTRYENWYIHNNVFARIASGWPSSVIQTRGGLKNLRFINNTIHLEGPPVGIYAPYGPNTSEDIAIENNIFLRTNSHAPYTEPSEDFLIYPRTNEGVHWLNRVTIKNNIFHGFPMKLSSYITGLSQSGNQFVDPRLKLSGNKAFPFYEPQDGSIANTMRAGARYNENQGTNSVDPDPIPVEPETPVELTVLPLPILVNAGGESVNLQNGKSFLADTHYQGESRAAIHQVDITNSDADPLYQSERWGQDFSYRFKVSNGKYRVTLHFAEIYWAVPGKRVMDIRIQDSLVIEDMDVYAEGGGKNLAFQKVFEQVEVTDSLLTLSFSASADNAKLSAIEITWENSTPAFALSTSALSLDQDFEGIQVIDIIPDSVPEQEQDQIVSYSLSPAQSELAQVSIDSTTGQVVITALEGAYGVDTFVIQADDGQAFNNLATQQFVLNISEDTIVEAVEELVEIRINAGGAAYTTQEGKVFAADDGAYAGGTSRTYSTTGAIAATEDDALYLSERWGNTFSYNVPVSNGTYDVTLHFAEIYWQDEGRRVLNVNLEGGEVELANLDIVKVAGSKTAYARTLEGIVVEDGEINLDFSTLQDNAKVSAIEIVEREVTEEGELLEAVLRINCGSDEDQVIGGEIFMQDTYFTNSSRTWENSDIPEISGTERDALYRSERFADSDRGSFAYNIPLENGTYQVNLHFAEIYFGAEGGLPSLSGVGRRLIHVDMEGERVIDTLDLASRVGSKAAYMETIEVVVADEELTIELGSYSDRPKISAIEIFKPVPKELTALRINAGGLEDLNVHDMVFVADTFYSDDNSLIWRNNEMEEVNGTAVDELYFSERYADRDLGAFSYEIPVVNGEYMLYLHFAEIYFGVKGGVLDRSQGERILEISVENETVLPGLDIAGEVGSGTALIKEIPVVVQDGILNIRLGSTKNRPKLSALELLPATESASALVYQDFRNSIRINTGGTEDAEFGGYTFIADTFHTANSMRWYNEAITDVKGTEHDDLYRSERFADANQGDFSYEVPVEDGDYVVYLHFAEIYFGAEGGWPHGAQNQRIMNVSVEGTPAIEQLDLYYEVGAMFAYVQEVRTTVTDGILNIDLGSTKDRAKISAIEILIPSEADQSISRVNSENRSFAQGGTSLKDLSLISLAPNPAVNTVKLLVDSEAWDGAFEVILYDALGRKLRYYQLDKQDKALKHSFNIEDLIPGLYVVSVSFQGETVSQKLWKAER